LKQDATDLYVRLWDSQMVSTDNLQSYIQMMFYLLEQYVVVNSEMSVMIAQCKNKCISLSVLSMVRDMIAQWKNECTSLSVLSMVRDMIAQWKNECISLPALSMVRVMIAQWKNEYISLSVSPWPGT